MEESLSKFMNESAKRHEENSNLIKEIRASTNTASRNQRASIKGLEIQIRQMSKVLQERIHPIRRLGPTEQDRMGVMKDKIELNGRNELGNFVNAPVFIGNFYASYVEARRFDGIITIRDGNDSVSEQDKMNEISQSYQKLKGFFKGFLNLGPEFIRDAKVGEQDKMNGMSHSYQKLKGFFKGVLNLGPEFIRDTKVEEWLTRGHTSMHEMQIPEIGLHGFLIFCTGPRWKEIDNVGEVSITRKILTGLATYLLTLE
ncbi:hypothetical protein Tco_0946537 [Tanacetum coccineum]